jgi:hypothetical protein
MNGEIGLTPVDELIVNRRSAAPGSSGVIVCARRLAAGRTSAARTSPAVAMRVLTNVSEVRKRAGGDKSRVFDDLGQLACAQLVMREALSRIVGDEDFCRQLETTVAKPCGKCLGGCDFGEVSFVGM